MKYLVAILALTILFGAVGVQSAYAQFIGDPIGTISGFKFNDLNGNGIWDQPVEPAVPNTEICLYESGFFGEAVDFEESFFLQPAFAGTGGFGEPILVECTNTLADGSYEFLNVIVPRFYWIVETVPDTQVQTFPNIDECFVFGEVPSSEFFGSTAHCVDLFNEIPETNLDFGNALAASLHGQKLSDTDGDGIGDTPIPFVLIQACKIDPLNLECELIFDEQNVFETRTMQDDPLTPEDETGHFWLKVPPGDYRVQELAFGTSQIFPADGAPHFVSVSGGDVVENLDFVNEVIPPGTIQGSKFQDANGDGIKDLTEIGVSGVTFCLTPSATCTQTNFNGDFTFFNVPAGQYVVSEILPSGSVNTTPRNYPDNPSDPPLIVTSGGTFVVPPFGNTAPTAPAPEITISPLNSHTSGGLPTVYYQNSITISKDTGSTGFDHCGADSPVSVDLQLDFTETGTIEIVPMDLVGPGDVWSTVPALDPFFPLHGVLNLTFLVECPGNPNPTAPDEIQIGGSIYIDPSGQITDVCTDEPIVGAQVTLFKEFPPTTGNFVVADPSDYIQTTGSTQSTDSDGRYGWDTLAGSYKVSVSAAGFVSQESIVVTVPPPVFDLDLVLDRVDACPAPPPEPTCTLPDVDDAPRDQCADVPVNEICEFACDDGFRPVPPNLTCQDDGEFDANPVCEAIPTPPEPTKVEVCHKGKKTITISENAVPAHLKHGDTVGSC